MNRSMVGLLPVNTLFMPDERSDDFAAGKN